MREHVVHVHFKDGIIKGDGAELAMMGEGEIDFSWIMAKLDELGYEGDIALEYELESEPPDTGLATWFQAFEEMV
jgi:sugar phosphate isomerase/epimerase